MTSGGALAVFLGGGLGAVLRYALGLWARGRLGEGWPWGTLLANLAGSFAIGLAMAWAARGGLDGNVRLAVVTGVLGGFTTFSAFSFESFAMLQRGQAGQALGYSIASLVGGLAATWAGYRLLIS